MAEAQDIYRQFCATPLRLRAKRRASPTSSLSTESDGSPASAPHVEMTPRSQFKTPTKADVQHLGGRIEVECRVDDAPAEEEPVDAFTTPRKVVTPLRTRVKTRVKVAATPSTPEPVVLSVRKHKRVTRSVVLVNTNTGGLYADTPTKAMAPPKRSRKGSRAKFVQEEPPTETSKGNDAVMSEATNERSAKETFSITRNIMDAFADIDAAMPDPEAMEKPKSARKKALVRRQPKAVGLKNDATMPKQDEEGLADGLVSITRNIMDAFAMFDDATVPVEVEKPKKTKKTASARRQPTKKTPDEPVSITRNIKDAFAETDDVMLDPVAVEKPKKEKKTAPTRRQPTSRPKKPQAKTNKSQHATTSEPEKEHVNEEPVSIIRNIMDEFVETDDVMSDPVAVEKPKRTKKKALSSTQKPQVEASENNHTIVPETEKEKIVEEPISIVRNIMDTLAEKDDVMEDPIAKEKPKNEKKKAVARRQPKTAGPKKPRQPTTKLVKPAREPVRRSGRLQKKTDCVVSQPQEDTVDKEEPVLPQTLEETVHKAEHLSPQGEAVAEEVQPVEEPIPMEIVEQLGPDAPPPLVIDVVEAFCAPLLDTKTTSGALFALWFNALGREVEDCASDQAATFVDVLRGLFAVCSCVCQCETMARDRVASDAGSDEETDVKTTSKTVRFRHFDLSSISLSYHYDKSVPGFVEGLLRHYVDAVDHIIALWNRRCDLVQADMIAHVIGVLSDTDRLTERTRGDGLVSTAFRSMSEFEHDEVRASQRFFSREFAKLASDSQPVFMEVVFSSLIAGLLRFRLRELFLPFDPKELLDEGDRLQIATYEHQDYGAAIHRALQELHLYQDLAAPLLSLISTTFDPRNDALKKMVHDYDLDDLIHVERLMLASRYLRLSFRSCVLVDSTEDEETAQLRENLEQFCALVKRLRFEDEAHFYPLVSVEEFVRELERQEKSFKILEKLLETVVMPHYDAEAPCVECNEIVTRAQQDEAITCCSCSGRFHLNCLGLPPSFVQFAGNYACPFCYVGRTR